MPLVLPHQRHQCVRHAEDQMIVVHGQQFLLALGEPLVASVGLALGTVPVTTRGVGDGLIAAVGTLIAMSAERSCAAACDGVEHLKLRPGKRVMFMEPAACNSCRNRHCPKCQTNA